MSRRRGKKRGAAPHPPVLTQSELERVALPAILNFNALGPSGGSGIEPGLDALDDAEFLDDEAPDITFTGDPATGSGLDIDEAEFRDDETSPDPCDSGAADAESLARAWLRLRVKLKARRIAGLPESSELEALEDETFRRLKAALENDR